MSGKGKGNRIQVDLDLLQGDQLAKLEQFGKDFNNSIDRLAGLLSGGQGSGLRAGNTVFGDLSPNASTSAGTDQTFANAKDSGMFRFPRGGSGPSMPPGDISNYDTGGPDNIEKAMAQFQRRIGSEETAIPTSLRQALGYYGEGQLNINPFSPFTEAGGFTGGLGGFRNRLGSQAGRRDLARRANDAIFNMQATKAMAMKGMGAYTGFFGGVQAITNSGWSTNANDSRRGWFGSGLFSDSFWHGLNENLWQPLMSSTFGLDPSYSLHEAQQARQVINSYGWSSGNWGDQLALTLKDSFVNHGIDPQSAMAFLDPMLRWGGNSFNQINSVLASIPQAATAAGYNLQQFTQQLVSTSEQIAHATGTPIGTIASGIMAISATTGLPPTQAGEMMTWKNALMAGGYTGKHPWDVMLGNQQQAFLAPALARFKSSLGMPVDEWVQWFYHGTPAQREEARKRMYLGPQALLAADPNAFFGMQPFQIAHMLSQAGGMKPLLNQTHILDAIQSTHSSSLSGLEHKMANMILHYYGGDKAKAHSAEEAFTKSITEMHLHGNLSGRGIRSGAFQALTKDIPAQRRGASNYMIDLTPDAKKLVTLMGNNHDPSHQNSTGYFGRLSGDAGGIVTNALQGDGLNAAWDGVKTVNDLMPWSW